VTGQGVIASSWFRLRGNPKFFTLSNLLFSFLRLRKARSPPQSLLAMTEKGGFPLLWFRPLVEPFRHPPPPAVIPEIFNRESRFLNTVDPGLKIAGVTKKAIEPFRGRLKTARKSPGWRTWGNLTLPSPRKLPKPSSRARRILPCVAIPSF